MPDATALSRLLTAAGLGGLSIAEETLGLVVRLDASIAPAALSALCDEGFTMLVDLLVADLADSEPAPAAAEADAAEAPSAPLEITWHLRSFAADEELFVKARVPYDAEVPSVWRVYAAALYPEREAAELFGMTFAGHPNPKRLLTTEETQPFLLRKSTTIRTREQVLRPGVRARDGKGGGA